MGYTLATVLARLNARAEVVVAELVPAVVMWNTRYFGPLAGHPLYCMAKAALAAMTRSLALDLGPDIRVNGIAPGAVLWPGDGKAYDDQQAMLARTPLRRAGSPDDVASAVLWLLRDAPFVTGQIIRVDGGRTLSV